MATSTMQATTLELEYEPSSSDRVVVAKAVAVLWAWADVIAEWPGSESREAERELRATARALLDVEKRL